jgi:hypothetical protein
VLTLSAVLTALSPLTSLLAPRLLRVFAAGLARPAAGLSRALIALVPLAVLRIALIALRNVVVGHESLL